VITILNGCCVYCNVTFVATEDVRTTKIGFEIIYKLVDFNINRDQSGWAGSKV